MVSWNTGEGRCGAPATTKLKLPSSNKSDLLAVAPPLPQRNNGQPVYTGQSLEDFKRRDQGLQYLVDWEEFGPGSSIPL